MASLRLCSPNPFSSSSPSSSSTTEKRRKKKKHCTAASCHASDNPRESAAIANKLSRSHQALSSCVDDDRRKTTPTISAVECSDRGIGIVRFLKGKRLLVTGATGFLGKVLVEKILRTIPEVGKIYVLIKAKDKEAAMSRLKSEIVDAELFETLQEVHGKGYQAFMLGKLIPVAGDVGEAGMGIEAELAHEISEKVDVIVNSAANTTFNESYDVALNINTMGTSRLMGFAKKFKRLKLLVHVSTAYANGQRQGRIMEKPFCHGDTIANEKILVSGSSVKPMPRLDIGTEFKLAFASGQTVQELKDLGLSRALKHGWHDTYTLAKAMGEMVINCMRDDIPVVVVRPSIIGSISREPSPGWIQGNRMLDPLILSYGKGQLTSFPYDANEVADYIPVDMVANAMLAAMVKHGRKMDAGIHVYHTCSSNVNPLTFRDFMRFLFEHFVTSPWVDPEGRAIAVSEMKEFSDVDEFVSYIRTQAKVPHGVPARKESSQTKIPMKFIKQFQNLARLYGPYTFFRGRFDNTNTESLIEEMSEEERVNFDFDVRSISWEDYFKNVHILGLRKHVMKGRGMHTKW